MRGHKLNRRGCGSRAQAEKGRISRARTHPRIASPATAGSEIERGPDAVI